MAGDGNYFVDHKRGEINQLKQQLCNPKLNKDPDGKRDVLKKVIAYMTLGIDVSNLFSEMTMATHTTDMVQKKMVYLYLAYYARRNRKVAVMVVNTLQRECRDGDPMVRGLALRCLTSLHIKELVEYISAPIRTGLADTSSYVRKTAVTAVCKLHAVAPETLRRDTEIVDILYNMLKDKDTAVVVNVINCLNEILADEGGMMVNKQILNYLLGRVGEFNEWGLCILFDTLKKYEPASQKEVFDIMNKLDYRIKHGNSAVILSAMGLFLNFTSTTPKIHRQVVQRIKESILTIFSQESEVAYPALCHVDLLTQKYPEVFSEKYKIFYVRHQDPWHTKNMKLVILARVASPGNCEDILNEIKEYVTDPDKDFSRRAIAAMAELAVNVPEATERACSHLLGFLNLGTDDILSAATSTLGTILQKYPDMAQTILETLTKYIDRINDPAGKAAVFWILGEFGDRIDDAPYILERFINEYEEQKSRQVRLHLLSATVKLFFKRPPEVQKMLGRLLAAACNDQSAMDVRDRAMFYYRLLEQGPESARKVVCSAMYGSGLGRGKNVLPNIDEVLAEFNTLSVIYKKPAKIFAIEVQELEDMSDSEEEEDEAPQQQVQQVSPAPTTETQSQQPAQQQQAAPADDFLDLLSFGNAAPAPQATPSGLQLNTQRPPMDQNKFQGGWIGWGNGIVNTAQFNPQQFNAMKEAAKTKGFHILAQGPLPGGGAKVYFFGCDSTNTYVLVELLANEQTSQAQWTTKSSDNTKATQGAELFQNIFESANSNDLTSVS